MGFGSDHGLDAGADITLSLSFHELLRGERPCCVEVLPCVRKDPGCRLLVTGARSEKRYVLISLNARDMRF